MFGPGELNPYDQFQRLHPTAVIEHGVFAFDGHLDIPLASALNHLTRAHLQERAGHLDHALIETQTAVQLAPDSAQTQTALGFLLLLRMNRADEGCQVLERALTVAQTIKPELQSGWMVAGVKAALGK